MLPSPAFVGTKTSPAVPNSLPKPRSDSVPTNSGLASSPPPTPVGCSDPSGDLCGSEYLSGDGKEEVTGVFYQKAKEKYDDDGNLVSTIYSKGIKFKFNDPENVDTKAIRVGTINKIHQVYDVEIDRWLNEALPDQKLGFVKRFAYFWKEGKSSQKLDFAIDLISGFNPELDNSSFQLHNGVAYNTADFGNYLIGMAAHDAEIKADDILFGAQINHMIFGRKDITDAFNYTLDAEPTAGFMDSNADQNAIVVGWYEREHRILRRKH